jgi:hypothetical protein
MARKAHNIHYIYKTTCNVTGRWYVGMHSTSNENDGYMGSGKRLRYSIRKYGADNHTKEILSYHDSRESLVLREIEIVTNGLMEDPMCMNLCVGGFGFLDEEHQTKCSKLGNDAFVKKLLLDEEFKNKFTENARINSKNAILNGKIKKIEYDWTDKTHSEESKRLISEKLKGKGTGETNSQYGTCWVTKDGLNKKLKKDELENHLYDGWITGRK